MALSRALAAALLLFSMLPAASLADSVIADGGNITEVNITFFNQTRNWQGFAGQVFFGTNASAPSVLNATGRNVNASNLFFQIACDNPTSVSGFIFLSNSSTPVSGLVAGNLSVLNSVTGNGHDNATNTFATTSTFALSSGSIASVPTVFSYVNQTAQSSSFREGYFNQGNNLVFATVIEVDLQGYNTSFFDYQAIVPAPNQSTVPYFLSADLTFTCPGAPSVGGGGGGGHWPFYEMLKKYVKPPITPRPEQPLEITPDEVDKVLRRLVLLLDPDAEDILAVEELDAMLINENDYGIANVSFTVRMPEILLAPAEAHPYLRALWDKAFGWADRGSVTPRTFSWQVFGVPSFPLIGAHTRTPFTFSAIPPLMQPKQVDIDVHAFAGEVEIAAATAPFTVTVPPFAIFADQQPRGVTTIYYVVDNRGKGQKRINIEAALNRGRGTLVAEMLGPLTLPADSVAIYAHEYGLHERALRADRIDARLFTNEQTRTASTALR